MRSSEASTYSSASGTGLDRMKLSTQLPVDAIYASDFFSAARVQQLDRPVHIDIANPAHHCITLWSPGTHMFDVRAEGKRRSDAIMPPGIAAVSTAHQDSEFWLGPHAGSNFSFFIDPGHFERIFEDDSTGGKLLELRSDLCTSDPFFGNMMHAYLAEMEQAAEFSAIALQSIAMQVALHLARNYSALTERPTLSARAVYEQKRIERAKAFIKDNLEHPISLAEIAAAAGLSQYHFIRCFKASEGLTPYQYVIRQRVERARFLVCETEQSLAEVAVVCGFASQQHMTDVFTRSLGMSPGQMRIRHRH